MRTVIKNPRSGCALHGALQTVGAICGAVPIVHANAGCAMQSALGSQAGGAGRGFVSGCSVPSTNVQERHVVFGGASRLREQIKNTVKVMNGRLYVVLNSCESAMVGDDVEAMAREAREQGEAVVSSLTAGFHGDSHYGYEKLMADMVRQLPEVLPPQGKRDETLVNVLGVIPGQDIRFRGDLEEIRRILEGIGLKVHTFFGPTDGTLELAEAPDAALTVVCSKWGLACAEKLKELYGIPLLVLDALPAGPSETEQFVRRIADVLGRGEETYLPFLEKENRRFSYYYRALYETILQTQAGRYTAVVGDERTVLEVAVLLGDYLGAVVKTVIVTDIEKDDADRRRRAQERLKNRAQELFFAQDGEKIRSILQHSDAEVILGSSLDQETARRKQAAFLPISYPVYDTAIADQTYAGTTGAIRFLADYLTAVQQAHANASLKSFSNT
jgi:nitrogenase molybdenum-iron protein beta chain